LSASRVFRDETTVLISIVTENRGMPQDLHRHPGVHLEIGQQAPAGTPCLANGDPWHPRPFAPMFPVPVEVAWLKGCAVPSGEQQLDPLPERPGHVSLTFDLTMSWPSLAEPRRPG
jgi:hypothetical protein